MKITDVRAVQPDTPLAPPDWRTIVGQIVVAIDTDSGLTGYGVGGGGAAGVHLVSRLLRDQILGEDPTQPERLYDRMYHNSLPYGRKGLAIMAISGVDLALWDLRGQAAGVPVARLLADNYHRRVPAYATLGPDPGKAADEGFTAVKLHLPGADTLQQRDALIDTVVRARQIIGPDVRLMTDAFMRWDIPLTLDLAQHFRRQDVEWIEEPLPPDDFAGYAQLVRKCPIPIAGGEHEYTARGFQELVDRKLHAIVQPDITWCGGMTEMVRIYQLAYKAGVRVCQHRGGEIWGLHAIAALERIDPLAEAPRSWMTWVRGTPPIERGWIEVPEQPGFGAQFDESALP